MQATHEDVNVGLWVVTPCGFEDGCRKFLRNVGIYLLIHTALQSKRPTSTSWPSLEPQISHTRRGLTRSGKSPVADLPLSQQPCTYVLCLFVWVIWQRGINNRRVEWLRRAKWEGWPDYGDRKHLWNVGKYLPDYTTQHPRRQPLLHVKLILCPINRLCVKICSKWCSYIENWVLAMSI
jgi:hypothetical protein